jgi:sigma-B regulation protein RsbU (phosphoserine phosphatase)
MGRMRSALRAYVLETEDPAVALRKLDRKIQYFEPDAMATVLYGLYTPDSGEFVASSAGHLPPVLAVPGGDAADVLPIQTDPPIGTADCLERRSTSAVIPPGALLCCFTDGLVERRDQGIDVGIGRVAATLDELIASGFGGGRSVPLAQDACAAVMRTLVGNAPARDDIAMLALHRHRLPGRAVRPGRPRSRRPGHRLGAPPLIEDGRGHPVAWRAALIGRH